MAKKARKEKNKRFSYIGSSAKYTLLVNGDELNIIGGALNSLSSNISNAIRMKPTEYRKKYGHEKEDRRLEDSLKKTDRLINDLDVFGLRGYKY